MTDLLKYEYEDFLESKRVLAPTVGFDIADADLNPQLFPFQRDIVRWSLAGGKRAVFAHTGLGKGPIQMEWARQVVSKVIIPASQSDRGAE